MTKTFEVAVERDGQWWFAKAPALPGVHTQTKRLEQVGAEIMPLIAYFAEIPLEQVAIDMHIDLGQPSVQEAIQQLEAIRLEAESMAARASELTRELVELLDAQDLAQRDIGQLVGLSFQRVSQLLKERPRRQPA